MVQVRAAKSLPASYTKSSGSFNFTDGILISQIIFLSTVWCKFYQSFKFVRLISQHPEKIYYLTMQIIYCFYMASRLV